MALSHPVLVMSHPSPLIHHPHVCMFLQAEAVVLAYGSACSVLLIWLKPS